MIRVGGGQCGTYVNLRQQWRLVVMMIWVAVNHVVIVMMLGMPAAACGGIYILIQVSSDMGSILVFCDCHGCGGMYVHYGGTDDGCMKS